MHLQKLLISSGLWVVASCLQAAEPTADCLDDRAGCNGQRSQPAASDSSTPPASSPATAVATPSPALEAEQAAPQTETVTGVAPAPLPNEAQPGVPAVAPPAPRMLDDPAALPIERTSPYLMTTPLLSAPAPAPAFEPEPGVEPLWVLPPELIPAPGSVEYPSPYTLTYPGRERGYLDTPETISQIGRRPEDPLTEAREARLHRGLDWPFCGPATGGDAAVSQPAPPSASTPIDIDAAGVTYLQREEVLQLDGGITLDRGSQRIEADAIRYHEPSGDITTSGITYLEYPGLRIIGSGARFNLNRNDGHIEDALYRFSGRINLRGHAGTADLLSPTLTRYRDITYTTCRPGNNAWSLRARDLELDQDTGLGTARHARVRIRGVPVLYSPYLQWPIDDRRRSGFLVPTFGTSEETGFDLTVPYYLNIAPNLDATLYPRLMSKRGLMLGGELRYLTKSDTGTIQAEVLPYDAERDDGGMRGAVRIDQEGLFRGRWATRVDFSAVSDDEYLQDFGSNLDITSQRRLKQDGQLQYRGQGWSLLTRLQAFQTVDPNQPPQSDPYERLPQFLFTLKPRDLAPRLPVRIEAALDAEYDYFAHDYKVHGSRATLRPRVSVPLLRSWGHLIPSARVHLAQYVLEGDTTDPRDDPSYGIPSFDLDGRLIFERESSWLGEQALQTLEPRLYYLYTPYVDQSEAPVFDSSELTFNFANLFRSNRFAGADRIGDANQLTLALTSRMLKRSTGEEFLRLSLGQIRYFSDRRVQIAGPEQTTTSSPYAAELSAQLFDHWSGRATVEWDPEDTEEQWRKHTIQLQYRRPDRRLLNLAYRFDEGTNPSNRYDDTDLSFRLPLGDNIEMVGRWLYSIENGETMDAFAGIEFGQCCWRLRVLGRHFKNRPDATAGTSVMVQIELAGLGAVGNPISSFLEQEIYDY
jgi:LPS-assembly protein